MKTRPKRFVNKKPTLRFLLDFYDAWLRCDEIGKVAAALETGSERLRYWIDHCAELAEAKALADERRATTQSFSGYILGRLSAETKKVWERLQFWQSSTAYEKIEEILSGQPKRVRQELFIHALVSSNFDLSTACQLVSVSRSCLDHWKRYDLEFRQLIEEIQWHKKNFFERALLDLVEARHPAATIFANKTVNADRGYNEKVQVEHTGLGTGGVSLEDLDLDLDTRKKILAAMRQKTALQGMAALLPTQETDTETETDAVEI